MKHYDSTEAYPRDLVGYGKDVPHAQWPNGARIAVQFVLNYEEGGENCVLHGIYEYGSRAGVWRILREFEKRGLPLTVFGVGMALQRHPELTAAFVELGHEIACHGWRWIHYQNVDEVTEREHMQLGMAAIAQLTGQGRDSPDAVHGVGWYTGRSGCRCKRPMAAWCRNSSCPTRWTAMTCVLRCPKVIPMPTRSSSTLRTRLMCCMPRATLQATTARR